MNFPPTPVNKYILYNNLVLVYEKIRYIIKAATIFQQYNFLTSKLEKILTFISVTIYRVSNYVTFIFPLLKQGLSRYYLFLYLF